MPPTIWTADLLHLFTGGRYEDATINPQAIWFKQDIGIAQDLKDQNQLQICLCIYLIFQHIPTINFGVNHFGSLQAFLKWLNPPLWIFQLSTPSRGQWTPTILFNTCGMLGTTCLQWVQTPETYSDWAWGCEWKSAMPQNECYFDKLRWLRFSFFRGDWERSPNREILVLGIGRDRT